MSRLSLAAGVAAASLLMSGAALAQKSKDEMRVAINDMFNTVDPYVLPHDEGGSFNRTVFSGLIAYVERDKKFVPMIAKAWRIVEPGLYEFDLRDDIVFHSGNKLTADDVVYTLNFFADPKVKVRFKNAYDWFHPVEKLGDYKIRIKAKEPQADDLSKLAYRARIYDSKIHRPLGLEKYGDYGRISASGTGPYKMVSIDRAKVVLERFDGVKDGIQRAAVKRYIGTHMPDEQTQVAQMLTGGVDAIRNISTDNAKSLSANPELRIHNVPSGDIVYITLDAAGRSANKIMTDERIRRAVIMAIDRDNLIKHIVPGDGTADKLQALCFDWTKDCSHTVPMPKYDPAGAKKLLAEAGHPNGFDIVLDVHEPIRQIAEAVAGELRKVGIRATVQPLPLLVYVKKRGDGEFTMFTGFYPTGAQPEAGNLMDFFFGQDRDYYKDDLIHKAAAAANVEFDDAKRIALYRKAIDRVNEKSYFLPFSSLPTAYATTKDVKIMPDAFSYAGVYLNDVVWADYAGK